MAAQKYCTRCGGLLGPKKDQIKLRDSIICSHCFESLGLPEINGAYKELSNNYQTMVQLVGSVPLASLDSFVQRTLRGDNFSPWYVVDNIAQFDDRRREARFAKGWNIEQGYYSVPYDSIRDFNLDADDIRIYDRGLFTVGVRDYTRSMKVDVFLNEPGAPTIPIWLIQSKTKKDSFAFRKASDQADMLINKLNDIVYGGGEYTNSLECFNPLEQVGRTRRTGDTWLIDDYYEDDYCDWDDDDD